jgi:phenylacetate-CoA ligase
MLILGGVNVFPSQIEHVLMNIPDLGDQYQIVISHKELDRLAVKVETPVDKVNDPALLKKVQGDLLAVLGISADVELVALGTLPRSEVGKAQRVFDLRQKQ